MFDVHFGVFVVCRGTKKNGREQKGLITGDSKSPWHFRSDPNVNRNVNMARKGTVPKRLYRYVCMCVCMCTLCAPAAFYAAMVRAA